MKKLIPFLVLLAGVHGALAQTVDFNQNRTFNTTDNRLVFNADHTTPLVGTNFVAQLQYEAQEGATSLTPVALVNRFRAVPTTDLNAGTWVGATRTLTGRVAGDVVTLQVVAWDQNAGATFDLARAAGGAWGISQPWDYTIPAAGSAVTAFYIHGFRSFSLVPEPSVIGLGLIGIGALFMLRRRKA
jgi:hypothetical protein